MVSRHAPVAPFFTCDLEGEWIELDELVPTERSVLKRDFFQRYEFAVYDSTFGKWTMRYEVAAVTIWDRLFSLSRLPQSSVSIQWTQNGRYELDELRSAFLKAVENDADAMTRFLSREELENRLVAAKTFEDLVQVWHSVGMNI